MIMIPKVSVIMPCYNEPEDVFRRSLESVIGQTLQDIEIILILDNPHNSQLKAIISEYQKKCSHIVFLEPPQNLGRGNARNLGISVAQGKYIAIHDADDVDMPERLSQQYDFMEADPDIGVVFSDLLHIDAQGLPRAKISPLLANQVEKASFFQNRVNHVTMFVRKEALQQAAYSNLEFAEDLDLWMQLFKNGVKFGYISEIHTHYLAPSFSTHNEYIAKMKGWKKGAMYVLLKHYPSFFNDPYIYGKFLVALSDYIMLHFGEKIYLQYRTRLTHLARILKTIGK